MVFILTSTPLRISDAFGSTLDLLPTITSLAGGKLPDKNRIDGYDISGVISGKAPSPRRELLYYSAQGNLEGLRQEDWKLLVKKPRGKGKKDKLTGKVTPPKGQTLLFNLAEDLSETTNLAEKHPEKVKVLQARMKELDEEITAHARPVWQKE